jgi:hypothetical protein
LERTGVRPTRRTDYIEYRKKNREGYDSYQRSYYKKHQATKILLGRDRKKDLVDQHGGACLDCGGVFHPAVFDFHHRDPEQKKFSIAKALGYINKYSADEFDREVAKCDMLCKICHCMVHILIINERIGIQ